MAYHSSAPPPRPKAKGKSAPRKPKGLTDAQKKQLKEAEKHHTKKHIDLMKKLMKGGMSFSKAHNEALKKVGK